MTTHFPAAGCLLGAGVAISPRSPSTSQLVVAGILLVVFGFYTRSALWTGTKVSLADRLGTIIHGLSFAIFAAAIVVFPSSAAIWVAFAGVAWLFLARRLYELLLPRTLGTGPRAAPVAMIEPPNYISGFKRILDAYGYWPSFHDSPVLRYLRGSDHIELDLEAWEMTPEVDSRGYFVLTKRHEIGFRFSRILTAEMNQFSSENTLLEMEFSPVSDYDSRGVFDVSLISAIEGSMCGSFTAACGEVLFIRPTVPHQPS
jgi:hypothetical protein